MPYSEGGLSAEHAGLEERLRRLETLLPQTKAAAPQHEPRKGLPET
jgi:hypothetical protein